MRISDSGTVSNLLREVKIPRMFHASQVFPRKRIDTARIKDEVFAQIELLGSASGIKPGMRIAITAGSRGIRNIDVITRSIVGYVTSKGATAFIVPAMGSHGGATDLGQLDVLSGYGITEESMGCEIRSSMQTVNLGLSERGKPVYMDKNAYESDGIIVSCRIKPHNAFRGPVESGACKMMAVGLGKRLGAEQAHSDGMGSIADNIMAAAKVVINSGKILFAVGCLENAYDETMLIEAIEAKNIISREKELLKLAFDGMPSILVNEGDVLIVDEIGKNYSGTGVDPNVTGTFSTPYATGGVDVKRTCFLRLTECSHGNALGVGLASAVTKRIFDEIDADAMYANCITSTVLSSARIPCVLSSEKEAIQFCIKTCNGIDLSSPRVIRIPNSLHIGSIMLSESYYDGVLSGKYPGVKALDAPVELEFNQDGTLITNCSI